MTWKRGTVRVAVKASVLGSFAVTGCFERDGWWTVTHVASGFSLGDTPYREHAVAACELLGGSGYDFSKPFSWWEPEAACFAWVVGDELRARAAE